MILCYPTASHTMSQGSCAARESTMTSNDRSLIKWTLGGASVGAVLFLGLSVSRSVAAGASAFDHLGPVAAMGVIGFTVGALVGPLLRGITTRRGRG